MQPCPPPKSNKSTGYYITNRCGYALLTCSEYERDYHNEIYGTTDCDIYQSEDQLSSGYTEISGERRMQDFSSVTRISNVSLGKSNTNFKDKDGYLHLTRF